MAHGSWMMSDIIDFHEANFVSLPDQSNVYGLVHLNIAEHNVIIVATIRAQILCFEYLKDSIRPSVSPINFTYIPADAEVISIDAFVKKPNGVIFGVTLVKRDSDPKEFYFNLYGLHCLPSAPFNWDKIAEDWQARPLNFTPFQLMHTQVLAGDHWETVFLLTGDDLNVHLYQEIRQAEVSFEETPTARWFPELQQLSSSVTYMDMRVVGDQRFTALGCQSGQLMCAVTNIISCEVVRVWWSNSIDGPISSVKILNMNTTSFSGESRSYHLVVASALELGAIFLNVMEEGFSKPMVLPESHKNDSVLCVELADVDWDGQNEIILGTFGKNILVYKLRSEDGDEVTADLIWQHSLAHRIHCMWYGDLTHDGLSELAIISTGGIHILQHNIEQAKRVLIDRLIQCLEKDECGKSEQKEDNNCV